ncbi:PTS sugar transporter subunit IIA [Salibacterium halotolerans]|uniref:PTS system, galactitol-specific IIA component n=1 Tax=Salibacterium halotolerans TaxID=1884432 RepID=A0A1I5XKK4_9BACI|nr:PTS sugar transporter subunit IIA [Salibacterium halotolerans]SFQ32478.1 PTS system, galactitol-specific IIA component [Salibacterium halotolerans]
MSDLYIDETLILNDLHAADADEALRTMALNLYDHGLVKESYIQAVINREQEFATGLPTKGPAVAIPHTNKEHVHQKTLSIGVLATPVPFGIMGEESETVPVELVFMLAMDDEHSQLSMLQQLMAIFQDEQQLSFFKNTNDKTKQKEALIDALSLSRQGGETR